MFLALKTKFVSEVSRCKETHTGCECGNNHNHYNSNTECSLGLLKGTEPICERIPFFNSEFYALLSWTMTA